MADLFAGKTLTREYTEDGHAYEATVHAGLTKLGQQTPYISVTVDVYRRVRGRLVEDSFGCQHDLAVKLFPEVAGLIPLHLVAWDGEVATPLHYKANARYWLEMATGQSKWTRRPYDPDPIEAFQSTVVWGAAPEFDTEVPDLAELDEWLDARQAHISAKVAESLNTLGIETPASWQ